MSDIVERLRSFRSLSWFVHANDKYEISLRDANKIVACGLDAADEIDRLRLALSTAQAEGMEEAARIAEKFEVSYAVERDNHEHGTPEFYMNNSGSYASMDIAAAIRRAKESKT